MSLCSQTRRRPARHARRPAPDRSQAGRSRAGQHHDPRLARLCPRSCVSRATTAGPRRSDPRSSRRGGAARDEIRCAVTTASDGGHRPPGRPRARCPRPAGEPGRLPGARPPPRRPPARDAARLWPHADRGRRGRPGDAAARTARAAALRAALESALVRLAPELRATVLLRDGEGRSTQEAADILEREPAAFKSRLRRGRMALPERLAGYLG